MGMYKVLKKLLKLLNQTNSQTNSYGMTDPMQNTVKRKHTLFHVNFLPLKTRI